MYKQKFDFIKKNNYFGKNIYFQRDIDFYSVRWWHKTGFVINHWLWNFNPTERQGDESISFTVLVVMILLHPFYSNGHGYNLYYLINCFNKILGTLQENRKSVLFPVVYSKGSVVKYTDILIYIKNKDRHAEYLPSIMMKKWTQVL